MYQKNIVKDGSKYMIEYIKKLKTMIIGEAKNPFDSTLFHKLSLVALFAWIGLGSDALSSSSYGPLEAFLSLGSHPYLGIFVALSIVITIFVICASYSQIVELFPTGGGGYLVASKLLSPKLGMLSGCALLIDYVLTIALSISSGTDAIFSFLPINYHFLKVGFATFIMLVLILLNLRGVKESVLSLVPLFALFMITHIILIIYAFATNVTHLPVIASNTLADANGMSSSLGFTALLFLILHSYSMGAGTYTGIEAVSNAMPILREPKVKTAKRTMRLMAISLSFMVVGLMVLYVVYNVAPQNGKTLNAILFENITNHWSFGKYFVLLTLISEAVLLFVAAQTGFLDGPRVLANMSLDHWVPTRFATLSDRFITQDGILIMGAYSLILILLTEGSVDILIVLYSIAVFVTFALSQAGMVRHWWNSKAKVEDWKKKLLINGIGLVMTTFILISVVSVKFSEGGWITLVVIAAFAGASMVVKSHYDYAGTLIKKLDNIVPIACSKFKFPEIIKNGEKLKFDPVAKTAVLLVNGFNGLGIQTLRSIFSLFGGIYKNFIFVTIGIIDVGVFKGIEEIEGLQKHVRDDVNRYVDFINDYGYYAEGFTAVGTDVVEEVEKLSPHILKKFPNSVFFGGQIVFPHGYILAKWLHNFTVFTSQEKLYMKGIPFIIIPVKVE
jgi:amino acid transporter